MNKMLKKLAIGTSLLVLSATATSALAACNAAGTQCSGNVSVLFFDPTGNLNIRLDGVDIPAEATCTSSQNYGQVAAANPQLKNFYAMALTAFSLDNPLTMRMVTNSATCEVAYTFMVKAS
jgi:hypothetical protein